MGVLDLAEGIVGFTEGIADALGLADAIVGVLLAEERMGVLVFVGNGRGGNAEAEPVLLLLGIRVLLGGGGAGMEGVVGLGGGGGIGRAAAGSVGEVAGTSVLTEMFGRL